MTEHEDTARLKFLAENLNTASVHIAIRTEKGIVQMWTHSSKWVDMPMSDKLELDDLRMLIDEGMTKEES